jgi:hypothetical protein
MKSYLDRDFVIDDPQARIRKDEDPLQFVLENGVPKLIPVGTEIKVTDAKVHKDLVYVLADGFGWTAKNNLKNNFLNETLAEFPPANNDEKGPNAAWDQGQFLKQLTLIQIVGADNSLKFISKDIADKYLELVRAAEADNVLLPLKSGFRTFASQQFLFNGFANHLPGFNKAAKPGFSNHQDGFAYDFQIGGFNGDPRYDWLKKNGHKHGFVRTVNGEPWHWEFRPQVAATGAFKIPSVTDDH